MGKRDTSGSFIHRLHSPSLCHLYNPNAESHSLQQANRLHVLQRRSVEPETPAGVVILLQAMQTSDEYGSKRSVSAGRTFKEKVK